MTSRTKRAATATSPKVSLVQTTNAPKSPAAARNRRRRAPSVAQTAPASNPNRATAAAWAADSSMTWLL